MLAALLAAAALSNGLLAVLEFKNKLKNEDVDAGFLADEVRSAALRTLPGLRVITRENMLVLLQAGGRKLENCEGECEVDTGRRIGADLVVSGELLKFGSSYKLDLKLHETSDGRLLAGVIASGKTVDELDAATPGAVAELLAPLKPAPQQQQAQAAPAPVAEHSGVRREAKTGLGFLHVPAGIAHLGCARGDDQCLDHERPPRTAQVGEFWIGRTEVTVAAFAECAQAGACNRDVVRRDIKGIETCNWRHRRVHHPMNCVTWAEAAAFCKWVGGRLPTAVEWEYAAKSGGDVIYPWGNDRPDGKRANFCDANCARVLKGDAAARADPAIDDGFGATAPVGTYPAGASKWGLLDMAGNVSEWTASDLNGGKEVRGGTWARPAANLRASHRFHAAADHHDAGTGFRCVQ